MLSARANVAYSIFGSKINYTGRRHSHLFWCSYIHIRAIVHHLLFSLFVYLGEYSCNSNIIACVDIPCYKCYGKDRLKFLDFWRRHFSILDLISGCLNTPSCSHKLTCVSWCFQLGVFCKKGRIDSSLCLHSGSTNFRRGSTLKGLINLRYILTIPSRCSRGQTRL